MEDYILKSTITMRLFLTLTAMLICTVCINAQNWTKEIAEDFKREKQVAFNVDLSDATIMDVSLEDYPEYFSGKYSSNEKYANLILEKFKNRIRTSFYKYFKKIETSESEAKFTLVLKLKSITEKGGFSGSYNVVTQGNYSNEILFDHKDGRWNDFETLLMENAEKCWKTSYSYGYSPYNIRLYPKKKK